MANNPLICAYKLVTWTDKCPFQERKVICSTDSVCMWFEVQLGSQIDIGNFKSVSQFADFKSILTLSLINISFCYLSCLVSEMKGKEIDTIASQTVSIVTATLQLVLLLEDWRPSCLRHVSMTSRIARIMCVFLTGKKKS